MEIVERNIFPFQEDGFFSPIRDKIDYAKILALAARQLLLNSDSNGLEVTSKMKLIVDKMSRLFFYKDKKYYSISFPFTTTVKGKEVLELTTYSGKSLDYESISAIIAILDSAQFRLNPSLIDFFIEPNGIEASGLSLLEEIFLFEPSYIRYDHDAQNEKKRLHPLNHLDINYSQYSTFKLGLYEIITSEYFENIQNIKTDCSYLMD